MKITAGILFYLLNRYGDMQHICHGADRMKLRRFEHFRNQKETEAGVLYIYADKKGVLLFCGGKKYKPAYILMKALKESNEDFSSLWIAYDNLDEDVERNSHLADEVSEYVGQIWNFFTQIQNDILEAILNQETIEEVMKRCRGLLREPFGIVDRDMLMLYQQPELPDYLTDMFGEDYSRKVEEDLLVSKEFHEAAAKREPFYYSMNSMDFRQYCINILADDYYYARLIVPVLKGQEKIASGAEQLAEYVASVIMQMIRTGSLHMNKDQNDFLHLLCQHMIAGADPDPADIRKAISEYHWENDHWYQVICLTPYHASGWKTQVENTMPAMTRKVEQTFRHSCAVFSEEKILWVINRTLSEEEASSYELEQKCMVLVRENVFHAGSSSKFEDAALMASAFREAEAALQIGSRQNRELWLNRFDDCRLPYMIEAIREKGIAAEILVHPAIPVLKKHDEANDSQLSDTLKMLVEKQGNVTQAAAALFIHRTTLFRRMNQIKELTGLDLDNPGQMLELQISYRILE